MKTHKKQVVIIRIRSQLKKLYTESRQTTTTLQGSFSAVSKPIFASKYALELAICSKRRLRKRDMRSIIFTLMRLLEKRTEVENETNFDRLVLCCIEAKFCNEICVGKLLTRSTRFNKIYMLLHRSDLNISAKFRQTFSHFSAKFCKIVHFRKFSSNFAQSLMKLCRNLTEFPKYF